MANSTFGAGHRDKTSDNPRLDEKDPEQSLTSDQERSSMFERMTARIDALIAEVAAWNPSVARHPEMSQKNSQGSRSRGEAT